MKQPTSPEHTMCSGDSSIRQAAAPLLLGLEKRSEYRDGFSVGVAGGRGRLTGARCTLTIWKSQPSPYIKRCIKLLFRSNPESSQQVIELSLLECLVLQQ